MRGSSLVVVVETPETEIKSECADRNWEGLTG